MNHPDLPPENLNFSKENTQAECGCMTPPSYNGNFDDQHHLGCDETNNWYGEVSIETCNQCGTKWLRYYVEYAAFMKSGRWYRGVITDEVSHTVTAQNSVSILEGLDWWIRGGSFFNGIIKKGRGRLQLGLF